MNSDSPTIHRQEEHDPVQDPKVEIPKGMTRGETCSDNEMKAVS